MGHSAIPDSGIRDSAPAFSHSAMRSKNIEYLVGIDHLRALAALLIVFYHGQQLFYLDTMRLRGLVAEPWARANDPFSALVIEGHTAVALFMVLSGFIFTYGAFIPGPSLLDISVPASSPASGGLL
jgi:uncharacterized membrane protein